MTRLRLTSELRHLKQVRRFVEQACRDAGLDDEAASDMKLAVGEAFTNCVKHGYAYEPDGRIDLTWEVEDGHLMVRVSDGGASFESQNRPDPDLTEAHEGGYGLYLMRQLTDRFEVQSAGRRGTTVLLAKKISGGGDAGASEKGERRNPLEKVTKELFGDIR